MANENLSISQKGINLIKKWEGVRLNAYQDSVGVWTIGYGHTKGVYSGMSITQAQAEQFLKEDIKSHVYGSYNYVKVQLNQNQFDALASFQFNLGAYILNGTTLLNYINAKQWQNAANEMKAYNKAGGEVLQGLVNRRNEEASLFMATVANTEGSMNKEVTVNKKGVTVFQDKSMTQKRDVSDSLYGQAFLVKWYYIVNGQTYYSLYAEDKWCGYLISTATEDFVGVAISKKVKISLKDYSLWSNFNFSAKKGNTTDIYGEMFDAKRQYKTGNGYVYYSLYDGEKWIGYLNTSAITVAKVTGVSKKFVINTKDYNLWNSFAFASVRNKSSDLIGQTFKAKVEYVFEDAPSKTYLSLYNEDTEAWMGYLNSSAAAELTMTNTNQLILIKLKDYDLWNDFAFSKVRNTTNDLHGKLMFGKLKYTHHGLNRNYYSVYSDETPQTWMGYLNVAAVKLMSRKGMDEKLKIVKKGYSLWNNFAFSSVRNNSDDFINKTVTAKFSYKFDDSDSIYYSLYDGSNWIGYLNKDALEDPKSNTFILPVKAGTPITSRFGPRWGAQHNGIDFGGQTGDPIYASKAGEVVLSLPTAQSGGFGEYIVVKHNDGFYTGYAHQSQRMKSVGDYVSQGQQIGKIGSTGQSTGPHLHFSIQTALWSGYIDPGPKLGV